MRRIKEIREKEPEREIVYTDETWLNAHHKEKKEWVDEEALKISSKSLKDYGTVGCTKEKIGKGKRLIVVDCITESGKEGKTSDQHFETAVEIQRAVEQRKEEGKEEETEINRPGSCKTRKRKLKSTADKSSKQPKQFRESANFIDENDEKKNGNEVGLLMESDYHDATNAECYEKYFENVCKLLKERSVIIIDNASYHSRNDENYQISTWRKAKYQEWLQKDNVTYGTNALRSELWLLCKRHRDAKSYKLLTKLHKDMGMKSCSCLHTTVISTQLS